MMCENELFIGELMKFNRTKLSYEDVVNKLRIFGLIWIGGNFITCSDRTLVCLNKEGYKIVVSLDRANRSERNMFTCFNPFTIENIEKFISEKRNDIKLIKGQEFVGTHDKLNVKCERGHVFGVSFSNMKNGRGCPICVNRVIIDENRFENVRPDLMEFIVDKMDVYDCSEHSSKYVDVQCPQCKSEIRKIQLNTLSSQGFGCNNRLCVKYNDNVDGIYRIINAENKKDEWIKSHAVVYIVKIFDESEEFYKIGLTSVGIEERLRQFKKKFLGIEIMYIFETNKYNGTYLEKAILSEFKKFQYFPRQYFSGYRECLKDINLNIIIDFIKNYDSKQ